MNLNQYPLTVRIDHLSFEFYSDGPKGRIRKVIRYKKLKDMDIYNLGFGDANAVTAEIEILRLVITSIETRFLERSRIPYSIFFGNAPQRG